MTSRKHSEKKIMLVHQLPPHKNIQGSHNQQTKQNRKLYHIHSNWIYIYTFKKR
jgi:hypothetical protein